MCDVCGVVAVVAADDGIAVRVEVNADVRDKRFDVGTGIRNS